LAFGGLFFGLAFRLLHQHRPQGQQDVLLEEVGEHLSLALLLALLLALQLHHLAVEVQEVSVYGLLRLQLIQLLEETGDAFPAGRAGVLVCGVVGVVGVGVGGRFLRELCDFFVELFEAMFLEEALQLLVDLLAGDAVDECSDHLDQRRVLLAVSLAESDLGDQPFEFPFDGGLAEGRGQQG
jgi:hypothetical protein